MVPIFWGAVNFHYTYNPTQKIWYKQLLSQYMQIYNKNFSRIHIHWPRLLLKKTIRRNVKIVS